MRVRDIITEKDKSLGYATSQHGTNLHKQERKKKHETWRPRMVSIMVCQTFSHT
jgi:hypothetical protein